MGTGGFFYNGIDPERRALLTTKESNRSHKDDFYTRIE